MTIKEWPPLTPEEKGKQMTLMTHDDIDAFRERIAHLEQALRESREEYQSALKIWADELKLLTEERDNWKKEAELLRAQKEILNQECQGLTAECHQLDARVAELSKPVTPKEWSEAIDSFPDDEQVARYHVATKVLQSRQPKASQPEDRQ